MVTQQLKSNRLTHLSHRQHLLPNLHFTVNSLPHAVIFLSASITASLLLFILVVRMGTLLSGAAASPSDPFAPYRSILPGQPEAALDNYDCQRAFDRNSTPPCSIVPEDGVFHLISVTTRQDIIVETAFYSDQLQPVDLVREWGDPDSTKRSESSRASTVTWHRGTLLVSGTLFLVGYQPHVRLVTLSTDLHR